MALHSTLTGADLHEPKGADAAPASTAYISNGAGSGSWVKVPASALDPTTNKTLNKHWVVVPVADIANTRVVVVPVPVNATLLSASSCITGAISGGDSTLTFTRAGAATIGTIVISAAGSGEGVLDTLSAPINNSFTGPSWLKIASDGGPTSGTSDAWITIEFRLD